MAQHRREPGTETTPPQRITQLRSASRFGLVSALACMLLSVFLPVFFSAPVWFSILLLTLMVFWAVVTATAQGKIIEIQGTEGEYNTDG